MSSVADEHIVDDLSTCKILDSYSSKTNFDERMNILIDRIMSIVNERLDNSQQCKNIFNKNSMQPAIYQILCEIKDKISKIRIISKQKLKTFF